MCGIAGLIHRGKSADIGSQMTSMLQALKHRGPDPPDTHSMVRKAPTIM